MNAVANGLPAEVVDELLEAIWTCREDGTDDLDQCLQRAHAEDVSRADLDLLVKRGLVQIRANQITLTKEGDLLAASIIRRHRLAERLLVDVLGMTPEQCEELACHFEHAVVPEVTNGICTLLGHPSECPHGRAIPPGPDCLAQRTEVASALQPLSAVACSEVPVRVAYLRTSDHERLHQLLSLGFSPGTSIRVHQRSPVLVLQIDQSEFALDKEVASDVYVWVPAEDS